MTVFSWFRLTACSSYPQRKLTRFSLLDGYARVDHFDRDAFNEGQDLQA